jgi:putative ABC transport system permease protein
VASDHVRPTMSQLKNASRRVRSLMRREAIESGLDDEIRFHIDQQTEKNVRAGMTRDEARRQAFIKFGGVERVKESTRDEFRPALLEDAWRDVRYGVRALRRAPGFTMLSALTLALSIGAATAVFSVVNGVLLKPLPYPDADALVSVWHGDAPLSATQFFTYRDENQVFAAFGLWSVGVASVAGVAEPEEVQTLRVTHGTLQALGVAPSVGRWFSREDDTPGSPESVILTNGYWQRRYAGDPAVIGRTMIVDSRPRVVIGVMPAGFRFLDQTPDLIVPLRLDRTALLIGAFNYFALGRLKPDVTITHAAADVARMVPLWLNAWPLPQGVHKQRFDRPTVVRPLKQDVVGDIGNVLWVVMGTIGLVLLIACANVANLVLVRAERRQQELAVRAALGAGWSRIARQLLVESLTLGLLGGLIGLIVTVAAVRVLTGLGPESLPRLTDITVDLPVLAFALIASVLSSVLFGLLPIVKHARLAIVPVLGSGERTGETRQQHRARNTLVVLQVSLALVLLVGSGLMIRTFIALRAIQPGFKDPNHVQLVRLTIPATLVEDPEHVFRMQRDIRNRMATIPGVAAASFTSAAPMEPFMSVNTVFAEGQVEDNAKSRRFKFISPGLFETVGTRVVAGRDFTWSDVDQRRPVAVISENMARQMWGDAAAALGRRIRENPTGPWREVIGVVADVFDDGVHAPAPAMTYWPAVMDNFEGERIRVRRSMTFAIRSSRAGSEGLLKDVQTAVWAVNANLPIARVQTLDGIYQRSFARTSFTLVMLAIAAAMALLLGLVGIYGVIAYAVTQRTREIGIRFALGARPEELKRTFVREGMGLAVVGVTCGLAGAVALTRLMSSLVFGISPLDPVTYVAVSIVLIAAAAIASYIPAHRAITADPTKALRSQ